MKPKDEYELNLEFEHQLSKKIPIAQRIKAIKELTDIVIHANLDKVRIVSNLHLSVCSFSGQVYLCFRTLLRKFASASMIY